MKTQNNDVSSKTLAKIAGILFLLIIFLATFSMIYIPSKLFVVGDGVATVTNIQQHQWLFRLGIVSDLVVALSEVVLTVALYFLLKPASKIASLIMAIFRLAMATIQGVNILNSLAVLELAINTSALMTDISQVSTSFVLLFINLHNQGVFIWEAFFGLHLVFLSYALTKSNLFPKMLGWLSLVAAGGYLTHSFGNLLWPYSSLYGTLVAVGSLVGEVPFVVWLLWKGPKEHA